MTVLDAFQGSLDPQAALLEVDITPGQPQQFTHPHASPQRHQVQAEEWGVLARCLTGQQRRLRSRLAEIGTAKKIQRWAPLPEGDQSTDCACGSACWLGRRNPAEKQRGLTSALGNRGFGEAGEMSLDFSDNTCNMMRGNTL